MLNFIEFQEKIKKEFLRVLPEMEITFQTVRKNNGVDLHAITIKAKHSNVAPSIYLDGYFMEYQNGLELNDIISEIVTLVLKPVPDKFSTVVEDFCDINFVKERIIMVAVNAAKNQELLNEVPHQIKLDLALIYKVVLDTTATVLVKNEHLKRWGITAEELYTYAQEGTKKLFPSSIQSMFDILQEMVPEEIPENSEFPMYVITNSKSLYGAASIFLDETIEKLEKLSHQMNSKLYLMPSSIHAWIAISTKCGDVKELSKMVSMVNSTQVAEEDRLSDHIYLFDAETKKISIVA